MIFTGLASLVMSNTQLFCSQEHWAYRTGRESCWARFYLSHEKSVCLSRKRWRQSLLSSGCWQLEPSWKSSASLVNDSHKKKKVTYTNYPSAIKPCPQRSFWKKLKIHLIRSIERSREEVSRVLRPYDPLGVLRKLFLNENTPDSPAMLLRRLGLVHLVSTTGIHLYAISRAWQGWIQLFLAFYWGGGTSRGVRWGRRFAQVSCWSLSLSLWFFNGAKWGMLRPWGILLLREIAQSFGFQWKKGAPLVLALIVEMLASRVFQEEQGGRWVYALAVGGGLYGMEIFRKFSWFNFLGGMKRSVADHLGLAWGSWILVAFWEIFHEGSVALATPILSLLSLPWMCSFAYPLFILSFVLHLLGWSWGVLLLQGLGSFCQFLLGGLVGLASSLGNVWMVSSVACLAGFCFASFLVGLSFFSGFRKKILASLVFVTLGLGWRFWPSSEVSRGAWRIEQLDVGQGDAALITGLRDYGFVDVGSARALSDEAWISLFMKRRIQKINWIALTHLDQDHAGGLLRLLNWVEVGCVATPSGELSREGRFLEKLKKSGLSLQSWNARCIPYPHFSLEGVQKKGNQRMGVVWVPLQKGSRAYVSAGDAPLWMEPAIASWVHQQKKVDSLVFKASHHGSRTSNGRDFLKKMAPSEVWISVGNNRYGHPSWEVLSRLKELHVPVRRTDEEGLLLLE